ncbi:glycosyltransferase family 2 protein [Nocardioides sp. WL0053]|uniref:Glycosyltransferase family 2 protein n=1 Tax=Nocardioides jiangsuensis TaxID=2866161 RepID=A0ABS7RML9_9ACTN|nr:glycosyltransferase family 2 protein [Nocardioides jiangsuensis]MBY9076276.1 glycosyltransferase family 2 protein [Nocardioides jiangsuensis]
MDPHTFTYSIVVPVYNSVGVVGTTVDRIVETFEAANLSYELVLVNDGSKDGSWEVIAQKARNNPRVVALNLLQNYGQHNANLAGLRESTGDYVITMDDDGQNPADQALVLIDEAMTGKDVVFGRFERKQHAGYRQLGSKMIGMINRRVFAQPPDLVVSNFRILRRDVVDRICASRTAYPYMTGQALMYSSNRSNVLVRHEARQVGKSSYNIAKILKLVLTILFSYSLFPLRLAALAGFAIAGVSFLLGVAYFIRALFVDSPVEGWTTIVVLLSIFNGVTIALLSMLGEYVVRTLNAVSAHDTYHVLDRVKV